MLDSTNHKDGKPYIIAEIASNFKGDYDLGVRHIEAASKAGASAVKFQLLNVDKQYLDATDEVRSLHQDLDKCTPEILAKFKLACVANKIDFMCSGTFIEAVNIIDKLRPSYHKIASAQAALFPQYIDAIMRTGRPVICSTGIAKISDLDRIKHIFESNKANRLELLHCRSQYPCPESDSDLSNINFLKSRYGGKVGYSDHTLGITTAIIASMLGSTIFEKHFKLDDTIKSPDAASSVTAKRFEEYVDTLNWVSRQVKARGEYRQLSEEEMKYRSLWKVKVFVKNIIKKGQIIKQEDLDFRRYEDSSIIDATSLFDIMSSKECCAKQQLERGCGIKETDLKFS